MAPPDHLDPARSANLAALLAAQSERTFLLTVHQFMRLTDQWWSQRFKVRMGKRASKLHKEILGTAPKLVRVSTDWRNKVGLFPRGILEQAFRQVQQEILDEAGENGLNAERAEPYIKEPPTVGLITERLEKSLAEIYGDQDEPEEDMTPRHRRISARRRQELARKASSEAEAWIKVPPHSARGGGR